MPASAVGKAGQGFAFLATISLVTNRYPLLQAVLWGATAATAVLRWRERGWPRVPLLTGAVIVGAVWSALLLGTREGFLLASPEFFRRDGLLLVCLLPLMSVSALAPEGWVLRRAAGALALLLSLQVLLAAPLALLGREEALVGVVFIRYEDDPLTYFCGLYQAHNAAGSVMALLCLASAAWASSGARGERLYWGTTAVLLAVGVFLTQSRGSLLALAAVGGFYGVQRVRRKRPPPGAWLAAAGILLVAAALFGPMLARRFRRFGDGVGTHTARWEWWKRGIREWTWSPIVGIGMGRYNDEERTFSGIKHGVYVATGGKVVNAASHAHNSYVHFLAEGGIVGLGVTAGFWAWVAWKLRGSSEPLRIAAFLGVLLLFAVSMTEHYMGGGILLLLLSSLVGAAWSLPEPPTADPGAPP